MSYVLPEEMSWAELAEMTGAEVHDIIVELAEYGRQRHSPRLVRYFAERASGSTDIFPGSCCERMGIPRGSTYGDACKVLLEQ